VNDLGEMEELDLDALPSDDDLEPPSTQSLEELAATSADPVHGLNLGEADLGEPEEILATDPPLLRPIDEPSGELPLLRPIDEPSGELPLLRPIDEPAGELPSEGSVPLISASEQTLALGLGAFSPPVGTAGKPSPSGTESAADLELALETVPVPRTEAEGTLYSGTALVPEASPVPHQEDAGFVTAVREVFLAVEKAVKMLNLYEGQGETCEKALSHAHLRLGQALQHKDLALKITPYEFLLDEQAVYTSQEDRKGLSYRLFRDGMRELRLLRGIDSQELRQIVELMRLVQDSKGEDDSITLLWEKDLPHVRYDAVDILLEGRIDDDTHFQRQVAELVELSARPLQDQADPSRAPQVLASLDPAELQRAHAWRHQRLEALRRDFGETALASLKAELRAVPQDLWQRAVALVVRLLQTHAGSPAVVDLLGGIFEDMWLRERWDVLAATCQQVGELARQGDAGATPGGGSLHGLLGTALARLCTPDRLSSLQPRLERCAPAEFPRLAPLLRILPPQANAQLELTLLRLPAGELQDQMVAVLAERGMDLLEFHSRRLKSAELPHVVAAISALRKSGKPAALQALRTALGRPEMRVRFAALTALEGALTEKDLPEVLSTLALDDPQLRDLCLRCLEKIPLRAQAALLVEQAKSSAVADWRPDSRQRLFQLLAHCGAEESDAFLIRSITALNPLRRRRVELYREGMIQAARTVGGARGAEILKACLASRPSESTRAALEAALHTLERP
jgi:hypothetical protein